MKYFSVSYAKQHKVMFGVILVVFGLLFWLLIKHAQTASATDSTGSSVVTNTGPSDAQVAASMQFAEYQLDNNAQLASITAQLQANADNNQTQVQLAGMQFAYQASADQLNSSFSEDALAAQLASMKLQLDNSLATTVANDQFTVDYAKLAYDSAVEQTQIGAQLQVTLGQQQLDAYKIGVISQSVSGSNVKEITRLPILQQLIANT